MRIGIVVIMMLFLQACAIFGKPTELDDTKGLSAERIYEKASERMTSKDYKKSVEYLKNKLADHELHVARHYMKVKAYIAALNRAKFVIESYPDSSFVEEALVIVISAYDNLGMNDLQEDNLRILKQNYPNSLMFSKGKDTKKQDWWKFWDKD